MGWRDNVRPVTPEAIERDNRRQASLEYERENAPESLLGKQARGVVLGAATDVLSTAGPAIRALGGDDFMGAAHALEGARQQVIGEAEEGGIVPDRLQRVMRGAVRQVPQIAAMGRLGGFKGIVGGIGLQVYDQSYNQAIEAGAAEEVANGFALEQAEIEMVTTSVFQTFAPGLEGMFVKNLGKESGKEAAKGFANGLARFMVMTGQEIAEENTISLASIVNERHHGMRGKIKLSDVAETIAETTAAAAANMAVAKAPSAAAGLMRGKPKVIEAPDQPLAPGDTTAPEIVTPAPTTLEEPSPAGNVEIVAAIIEDAPQSLDDLYATLGDVGIPADGISDALAEMVDSGQYVVQDGVVDKALPDERAVEPEAAAVEEPAAEFFTEDLISATEFLFENGVDVVAMGVADPGQIMSMADAMESRIEEQYAEPEPEAAPEPEPTPEPAPPVEPEPVAAPTPIQEPEPAAIEPKPAEEKAAPEITQRPEPEPSPAEPPAEPEGERPAAEAIYSEPEAFEKAKNAFRDDIKNKGVAIDPEGRTIKIVPDPVSDGRYSLEITDAEGRRSVLGDPREGWSLPGAQAKASETAGLSPDYAPKPTVAPAPEPQRGLKQAKKKRLKVDRTGQAVIPVPGMLAEAERQAITKEEAKRVEAAHGTEVDEILDRQETTSSLSKEGDAEIRDQIRPEVIDMVRKIADEPLTPRVITRAGQRDEFGDVAKANEYESPEGLADRFSDELGMPNFFNSIEAKAGRYGTSAIDAELTDLIDSRARAELEKVESAAPRYGTKQIGLKRKPKPVPEPAPEAAPVEPKLSDEEAAAKVLAAMTGEVAPKVTAPAAAPPKILQILKNAVRFHPDKFIVPEGAKQLYTFHKVRNVGHVMEVKLPHLDRFPGAREAYDRYLAARAEEAAKAPPKSGFKKKIEAKVEESGDAMDAAAAKLKAYMEGRAGAGVDPQMLALSADVLVQGVRHRGWKTLDKFVDYLSDFIGRESIPELRPYLERGWEAVSQIEDVEAADYDKTFAPYEETTDVTPSELPPTRDTGVDDGTGEPQADEPEVSREPDEQRPTEEGAGREGREVLPSNRENAEAGEDQLSGRVRDGSGGDTNADHPGLGGSTILDGDRGAEIGAVDDDVAERVDESYENHVIAPDADLATAQTKASLSRNVNAIKIVKLLESESRLATPEEKEALAQYTGWGGLSQAFDEIRGEAMLTDQRQYNRNPAWEKQWGKAYKDLKELMTEEEWEDARDTVVNAHYTSRDVIQTMWKLAEHLGFRGGNVLEPGAGVGHFAGLMPAALRPSSKMTMVEMDSLSSRIAKALYPGHTVVQADMNDFRVNPGTVSLAIGNVPFLDSNEQDAKTRYGRDLNLHNYFIARALDAVHPGGLAVLISTHNTLDSQSEQRKFLAEKGDLVGAIRLPNDAFQENAKTEVVTDILIFRRPIQGEPFEAQQFGKLFPVDAVNEEGKIIPKQINQYFVEHPEMVLGENSAKGSQYAADEYTVSPTPGDLTEKIDRAIKTLPVDVMGEVNPIDEDVVDESSAVRSGRLEIHNGKLVMGVSGKWTPVLDNKQQGYPVHLFGKGATQRAKQFVQMRDTYSELRDTMVSETATDEDVAKIQKKMSKQYDAYVKTHGPLGAGTKTSIFKNDPDYYRVLSLENRKGVYNPDTKKIDFIFSKAAVFTERTLGPKIEPVSADSAQDALSISLGWRGRINPEFMGALTQQSPEDVEAELLESGLVYRNPATTELELKDQYLSGNVVRKLAEAKQAVIDEPSYESNVKALEEIQPERVPIQKVTFRLGASWVPANVIADWAKEALGANAIDASYSEQADFWTLEAKGVSKTAREQYGTERFAAGELLQEALNMRSIQVYDTVQTGEYDSKGNPKTTRVINEKETQAAKAKAALLQRSFREWLPKQKEASRLLEDIYNDRHNNHVDVRHDGSHLMLPGSSPSIKLRPYQKNAIWRILQDGKALLSHAVGSGKTFLMIGAAMEMKRLGLAKRPVMVVQNATLTQFAASFAQMYPNSNVLVATKDDLKKGNRQLFLSRVSSGNWDAVVIAQSTFDRMPSDPEVENTFIRGQIAELQEAIAEAGGENKKTPTVKQLVKQRKSLQKRLSGMVDKQRARGEEDNIVYEDLGGDALFLDEAHAYKKPPFITKLSNLRGLNTSASQRSLGTLIKVRAIQEKNKGRNVVLATGTPVTNTLGEAWHMVNYVSPETNKEFGVGSFDRFVGTFAENGSTLVMNAGGKYVYKDALVKFTNGPELVKYIRDSWDILTPDDLRLYMNEKENGGIPKLKDGKVTGVTVDRTAGVESFMGFIEQVYEKFQGMEAKDRRELSFIPAIAYGAAKAASLDIRLVMPNAKEEENSQLNQAVGRLKEIYDQSAESKGTQLFFSDTFNPFNIGHLRSFMDGESMNLNIEQEETDDSTESNESKSWLYQEIKNKLIAEGIPEHEIAFASDAKTDIQRQALFERVQNGEIRILMGSTGKMGVGVNVQNKLVALHHFDIPWLPADIEQREGRILRFGNENEEVEVLRYAMKKTLGAAVYQATSRKAKFIWQVLSGKLDGRDFDDPASEMVLSIEEQLAAIQDNPLFFEKLELEKEKREMEFERESFQDSQTRVSRELDNTEASQRTDIKGTLPDMEKRNDQVQKMLEEGEFENFSMTSKGIFKNQKVTDIKQADKELKAVIDAKMKKVLRISGKQKQDQNSHTPLIAVKEQAITGIQIGPMDAYFALDYGDKWVRDKDGNLTDRTHRVPYTYSALSMPWEKLGLYTGEAVTASFLWKQVQEMPAKLAAAVQNKQHQIMERAARIDEMQTLLGREWDGEKKLSDIEERLEAITEAMTSGASVLEGEAAAAPKRVPAERAPRERRGGLRRQTGRRGVRVTKKPEEQIAEVRRFGAKLRVGAKKKKPGKPITKQVIANTFPGADIIRTENGWSVAIGDSFFTIELVDRIAIEDWDAAERAAGRKIPQSIRDKIGGAGSFSMTFPDGTKHDGLGLIRLANGLADDATLRHEAVHLARQAGIVSPAEWKALTDAQAKGESNPDRQEERVAIAFEDVPGVPSVWNRVRRWIRNVMVKMGITSYDAQDIADTMGDAGFWRRASRERARARRSSVSYQLRGRPDLANIGTSIERREFVDDVDTKMDAMGRPRKKADVDTQANADAILADDYQGVVDKLLAATRGGVTLSDEETLAAKMVFNREAAAAIASGNQEGISRAISLVEGWRSTGTEGARAQRQRRDPMESHAERWARALTETALTPPPKLREERERHRRQGNHDAANKISDDWAAQIPDLKERLKDLGVDLDNLHAEGYSKIQAARAQHAISQAKSRGFDAMTEYWRNSILSGITTQSANLIGNTIHAGWSLIAERMVEAAANTVIRNPSGAQLGELKYLYGGVLPGFHRAAVNFFATWQSETPTIGPELGRVDQGRLDIPNTAIQGLKGRVIRAPQRLLLAVDDFSKSLYVEMEVGARAYRMAKAEGLSGDAMRKRIAELQADIESPAWDAAYDSALELTFQQIGSGTAQKAKEAALGLRRRFEPIQFLIPFVTTPVNILETGLRKSPLGALRALQVMKRNRAQNIPLMEGMPKRISEQMLGGALIYLLMQGDDEEEPWITGTEAERTPAGRELMYRTRPSQSFRIGDKWYSYSRIEPFATALALTVDTVKSIRSGDPKKAAIAIPATLIAQTKEKTFLAGIGDMVRLGESLAKGDEEFVEAGVNWGSNFAVSWIPNIFRSISREADDTFMNRRVWGQGEEWTDRAKRRFAQKTEMNLVDDYPIYDVWGRPARRSAITDNPTTNWIYRSVVPIRVEDDKTYKGDALIRAYNDQNEEDARHPAIPSPYYRAENKTVYMSDGQYAEFVRVAGESARAGVEMLDLDVDNPTEQQVDWVNEMVTATRSEVRSQLVDRWSGGKGPVPDPAAIAEQVYEDWKRSARKALAGIGAPRPPSTVTPKGRSAFLKRVETFKKRRELARGLLRR